LVSSKPLNSAVVVVADGNYLPAACCALLSCAEAGRLQSNLFLIADQVSEGDLKAARNFLEAKNVAITIIPRHENEASYRLAASTKSAAKLSTYTRLHLDEYFDDRWDRLLYLDADVRVMTPLLALLELDLDGRALGAVRQEKGSERTPYFNAGVLLFDWGSVLADGLLEKARRYARENGHLCVWFDQDALNRTFEGLWLQIDPRDQAIPIFASVHQASDHKTKTVEGRSMASHVLGRPLVLAHLAALALARLRRAAHFRRFGQGRAAARRPFDRSIWLIGHVAADPMIAPAKRREGQVRFFFEGPRFTG
jgi:lipopolysaccharide biosynthesis glycosyltransferase